MSYDTEEAEREAAAVKRREAQRAEKRRVSKTPHAIEWRNSHKLSGRLMFNFSDKGDLIRIGTMSKNHKGSRLLISILAKFLNGAVYTSDSGCFVCAAAVSDGAKLLEEMGCVPVPAECKRCQGYGALTKEGKPEPHLPWGVACPACHGSGRALSEKE